MRTRTTWTIWLALLLLLAGCGDEHEALMKELGDRSPVKRAGAVKSLARLGDDEAYTLVSRSLEDRSAIVRIAAVRALDGFAGRDTSAGLIRASQDRDAEVRQAVVDVLGKRKDQTAQQTLIKMLLRGEPNTEVRKAAYQALREMGLSGERLSGEMAESQMALIREVLAKGSPSERVRAVQQAGRTVHPGGVDLVLAGLGDKDQDVVLAALGVLDGRGGQPALRRLQLLLSDPLDSIRVAAVRALADFGTDGLKLLEPALRDTEARVRLAALDVIEQHPEGLAPGLLCGLLTDPDPQVALRAARLLRGSQPGCDLAALTDALKTPGSPAGRRTVGVLSTLGGPAAIALLEEARRQAGQAEALSLEAALVRAGQRRPETARRLRAAFDQALDEVIQLGQHWVRGKLPPSGPTAGEAAGQPDRSRLSQEELNRLYQKHGLGPANADSPRGIGDILAGFEEPGDGGRQGSLFQPIAEDLVDRVSMSLDGLLTIEPEQAGQAVGRALGSGSARLIARVARILLAHNVTVKLDPALLQAIGAALDAASPAEARALLEWLGRSRDAGLVPVLLEALDRSESDKRVAIIEALGRLGDARAVGPLIARLKGYLAVAAARALARIGDQAAIEPLRQALGSAGPAEELQILMALAELGDREQVPLLLERLDASDPDVRRAAVRVLGRLGGSRELDAIKGLRYDLDRLVRAEVKRILEAGRTGDEPDAGPKTKAQGRGGQPAAQGQVRKGPAALPASGR